MTLVEKVLFLTSVTVNLGVGLTFLQTITNPESIYIQTKPCTGTTCLASGVMAGSIYKSTYDRLNL